MVGVPHPAPNSARSTASAAAGNVGANSIAHAVLPPASVLGKAITAITNPMAAAGGTETEEAVRIAAPEAFACRSAR